MKGDYKHIYFIIGIVLFFIIILAARFYVSDRDKGKVNEDCWGPAYFERK